MLSAYYFSNPWCHHKAARYSTALLPSLKGWVKDKLKAKPTEVVPRGFSSKDDSPVLLGKGDTTMLKR